MKGEHRIRRNDLTSALYSPAFHFRVPFNLSRFVSFVLHLIRELKNNSLRLFLY